MVYITRRTLTTSNESPGSLEKTAAAVEEAGGVAIPGQADHNDDDWIQALFERIEAAQIGQLYLLVNNAYAGVPALRTAYGKTSEIPVTMSDSAVTTWPASYRTAHGAPSERVNVHALLLGCFWGALRGGESRQRPNGS